VQLELLYHDVQAIQWGDQTSLTNGVLQIEREQLIAELRQDARLADVELELVQPGESCRILGVFDVVEPRAKLDPPGGDFPGVLGPIRSVGSGVTRVLRGMAATVIDPRESLPGHVIDMSSAPLDGYSASDVSQYAALHHVVLIPRLSAGVTGDDANNALRLMVLRAAVWLARTVHIDTPPDAQRQFTLTPVADTLPRVAYVYQLHSHQRPTVPGEPLLYGDNCRHLLPTIVHANEVLDGAVVRSYTHMNMETYSIQNHGIISDLYARHGVDLNFVGVVVYVANQLAEERQRATLIASNLVKETLRADGAIFTKSGGGAPNVDMALIAERCEDLGVKSTLILWETGAPGASDQDATLFNTPSLDAIVSIGASQLGLELGAVDRVVSAAAAEVADGPMCAAMRVRTTQLCGATDHLGASALLGARY
jgi:glycine reductase